MTAVVGQREPHQDGQTGHDKRAATGPLQQKSSSVRTVSTVHAGKDSHDETHVIGQSQQDTAT
jgi:hypothetical protein